MSKKKLFATIITFLIVLVLNICVVKYLPSYERENVKVEVTLTSNVADTFEMFYTYDSGKKNVFEAKHCSKAAYGIINKDATLEFKIPSGAQKIRMDFGNVASKSQIKEITINYNGHKQSVSAKQLQNVIAENDAKVSRDNDGLSIQAKDGDPYIVWDTSDWKMLSLLKDNSKVRGICIKFLTCFFIDAIYLVAVRKMKQFVAIPVEVFQNRKLIFNLAKNDFKTQFAGSYLGIIWAFVQPIVTVLVYWFVFEKGLKSGSVNTKAGIDVPFVLWLIAGIVPWFFFQDALNGGTNALTQYSYLVKKVVFNISILPIVKVISALFVHLFFIAFTLVLYSAYGYFPDSYTLQIIYYSFCMMIFVLGLVYATCAIVGFFKDLTQIINIVLQVGIWMTPIMWNIDTMDLNPVLIQIFKLNPMYYIVAGYRDALINKMWFWESPGLTVYFWIVTILVFGAGNLIFRKLKVHFADVL